MYDYLDPSKAFRFTNQRDAVQFARVQHGVTIEVVHVARGHWLVIIAG